MPEGHVLHRLADDLTAEFAGRRVAVSSPQGRFASEALLLDGTWRAIWADLVTLMAEGKRMGRIDTVRPEHQPDAMGRPARQDDHGGEVYVYRRTDEPCLVCGTPIRRRELAGRNLFWCPTCQKGH